jgi:co-chaperonin GroES (HSP10)
LTLEERKKRVIAQGEVSGHAHIVTGEATIEKTKEGVVITAGKNCAIKHLIEANFINEDAEVWTKEHADIEIKEGEKYLFVQQQEYNPYKKAIDKVKD